jgi:hypothetical protein
MQHVAGNLLQDCGFRLFFIYVSLMTLSAPADYFGVENDSFAPAGVENVSTAPASV